MASFYQKAVEIVGEHAIKTREPLARYTTFRIGGAADYIAEPETPEQIAALIRLCKEEDMPFFIMGNGSNILASDAGYHGLILHILNRMNRVAVRGKEITAQAGASLIRVAQTARANGLTGMEFASGIPGSVGGAVYMNAGAYGGEMRDVVTSVTAMDQEGKQCQLDRTELDFSYRHSRVERQHLIVLEATFGLEQGDPEAIAAEMKRLSEARLAKQPLEYPSAGSTFKRPQGYFAGKLIMDTGLRGYTVGGAQVSEKHCGFVVNKGGATARDVMQLVTDVQKKVFDKHGVSLELEVKTLGEFS